MEFPNLVYKRGGAHQMPGGTFDWRQVNDESELEAAKEQGWVESLASLYDPEVVKAVPVESEEQHEEANPDSSDAVQDDFSPPTREELEHKAQELGIKFDGRTSDAKLADKIAAALKAGDGLE